MERQSYKGGEEDRVKLCLNIEYQSEGNKVQLTRPNQEGVLIVNLGCVDSAKGCANSLFAVCQQFCPFLIVSHKIDMEQYFRNVLAICQSLSIQFVRNNLPITEQNQAQEPTTTTPSHTALN